MIDIFKNLVAPKKVPTEGAQSLALESLIRELSEEEMLLVSGALKVPGDGDMSA